MELPGHGVLVAASLSAYTLKTGGGEDTLVLGYVKLDGADTAMLQQIRNCGDPGRLEPGLAVKAVWTQEPVDHPMQSYPPNGFAACVDLCHARHSNTDPVRMMFDVSFC